MEHAQSLPDNIGTVYGLLLKSSINTAVAVIYKKDGALMDRCGTLKSVDSKCVTLGTEVEQRIPFANIRSIHHSIGDGRLGVKIFDSSILKLKRA